MACGELVMLNLALNRKRALIRQSRFMAYLGPGPKLKKTGKWSYQYLSEVRTIWRPSNSCQDLYLMRITGDPINS